MILQQFITFLKYFWGDFFKSFVITCFFEELMFCDLSLWPDPKKTMLKYFNVKSNLTPLPTNLFKLIGNWGIKYIN